MVAATVTSRGRITIPKTIRNAMQVTAGDRVEFVKLAPGEYLVLVANRSVTELKGMFGKASRTVSIEEMNRASSDMCSGIRSAGAQEGHSA